MALLGEISGPWGDEPRDVTRSYRFPAGITPESPRFAFARGIPRGEKSVSRTNGEGNPMASARLRVFPRPEEDACDEVPAPNIPIRLMDLYPLLAQAYRDNYVWLRDFEDEEILVGKDLFEVVRAFIDCRPSA